MKPACLKAALVAVALGAASLQDAVAQVAMAEVVLQTNADYSVAQLTDFLQTPAYTAAIIPGLLPASSGMGSAVREGKAGEFWEANKLPEMRSGLSFVALRSIGDPVFSISVVAMGEPEARRVLDAVMTHLEGLRSSHSRLLSDGVTGAQERVAMAQKQLEEARARWDTMREECNGLDPTSWLTALQTRLQEGRSRYWDLSMRFAVDRGLREHFAAQLADLPATIAQPGREVSNPAYTKIVAEMTRLKNEYEILLQEHAEKPNRSGLDLSIKSTMRELADLEAKLAGTPSTIPGPEVERQNPEYAQIEAQVLNVERSLAESSAQLAALEESIEQVTAEVLKFQRLADTQSYLTRQMNDLTNDLKSAQMTRANLRSEASRFDRPAVQWVAGPSVVPVR